MRQRENVAIMLVTQKQVEIELQIKSKKINGHRNDEERSRTIWTVDYFIMW